MKQAVFVILGWGLMGAAWAFAVLHGVPLLDQTARDQNNRHEGHKLIESLGDQEAGKVLAALFAGDRILVAEDPVLKRLLDYGVGSDSFAIVLEHLDFDFNNVEGYRLEDFITPPTWPLWTVVVVGKPAAFATAFPFWTIVGGIVGSAWAYLLADKLMHRRREKKVSRGRRQSGSDSHESS